VNRQAPERKDRAGTITPAAPVPLESLRDAQIMLVGAGLPEVTPVEVALRACGAITERVHPRDNWRWWFFERLPQLLIAFVTADGEDGGVTTADLAAADLTAHAPVLALVDHRLRRAVAGASEILTAPYRADAVAAHAARLLARELPAVSLLAGSLALDADGTQVWVAGRPVPLTPTEYALLADLVANRSRVLSYERLRADVWPQGDAPSTRGLAVHLARLRAKLAVTDGVRITTMRGVGYRLDDDQAKR